MELVVNIDEQRGASAQGQSGHLNAVEFDAAELRAGPTLGQGLYLVVSGPAPKQGSNVRLLPELGDSHPDYRRIKIVAEIPANDGAPVVHTDRYQKSMPLSGLLGTKGIELIGANGIQRFDVTGG